MDPGDETTSQRLIQTLEMYEFGIEMLTARLRRKHVDATADQIDQLVTDWLAQRPAETGDGLGVPVSLTRFR